MMREVRSSHAAVSGLRGTPMAGRLRTRSTRAHSLIGSSVYCRVKGGCVDIVYSCPPGHLTKLDGSSVFMVWELCIYGLGEAKIQGWELCIYELGSLYLWS